MEERPDRCRRLRLRAAADGRGGDALLEATGVRAAAHLLRQVHHRPRTTERGAPCETERRRPRSAAYRSRSSPTPRRGPRSSPPPPRGATTTSPRRSGADPLRGRHRRGPAGPAALPVPGLAVRLRRRPRRLPAGVDRAEGLGLRPAGTGAVPRLGRQGLRLAGARLARVPRPQRGVGADDLPLQRQRRPADQREHRRGQGDQGVRPVEPELGAVRGHATSAPGRTSSTASACTSSPTPTARADEHAQQRDLGERHAPDPVRPGPRALQPHAVRGGRRASTARPTSRPGTPTRTGRASARSPSS